MLVTNQHLDKLAAVHQDFIERGMLRGPLLPEGVVATEEYMKTQIKVMMTEMVLWMCCTLRLMFSWLVNMVSSCHGMSTNLELIHLNSQVRSLPQDAAAIGNYYGYTDLVPCILLHLARVETNVDSK